VYTTKVGAIISVFGLMVLLMLVTTMTAITSFHTALAQPIMGGSNMNIGSGGGTGMNFSSMNFANNIFNASSLFGSVGISMVNGVKVTAINLLENNDIRQLQL
jgi:hypothetical protein